MMNNLPVSGHVYQRDGFPDIIAVVTSGNIDTRTSAIYYTLIYTSDNTWHSSNRILTETFMEKFSPLPNIPKD